MQVISALQILSLYVRKLLREKPKSLLFKINKQVGNYPDQYDQNKTKEA